MAHKIKSCLIFVEECILHYCLFSFTTMQQNATEDLEPIINILQCGMNDLDRSVQVSAGWVQASRFFSFLTLVPQLCTKPLLLRMVNFFQYFCVVMAYCRRWKWRNWVNLSQYRTRICRVPCMTALTNKWIETHKDHIEYSDDCENKSTSFFFQYFLV